MTLRLIKAFAFASAVLYLLLPLNAQWNSFVVTGLIMWATPIVIVWLHWPSPVKSNLKPIRNALYREIMLEQERGSPAGQVVIAALCAVFFLFLLVLFVIGQLEHWPTHMLEQARIAISWASQFLPSLDHLATARVRTHDRCASEFSDLDVLVRQLTIITAVVVGLAIPVFHAAFYFAMKE
jgi:thiol:disulfide interchange protein